jgi:SAM-dependent methyltransferase
MSVDAPIAIDATWHDVECGAYLADLPLFERLAGPGPCDVLELGAGTGRVALHMAREGHRVTALDLDRTLLEELGRRASAEHLSVSAVVGDATSFELHPSSYDLILAPMQLAQLLGGAEGRRGMLGAAADHLRPGGRVAVAIVAGDLESEGCLPPLPDVRELDGWVFSSLPVEMSSQGGRAVIRRLRQAAPPSGEPTEELHEQWLDLIGAEELVEDATGAGLRLTAVEELPSTEGHVGSTVLVLEQADG